LNCIVYKSILRCKNTRSRSEGRGEWEGKYNYVVSSKLTFQVGFSIFQPPAPSGFKERRYI